eukprot:TRINITY_DN5664_c0_g1_i19.p1 TRINITY_DN5664_c0_g1~~TRINITY_DN5664_c0_g1_i19.p1  ORF type:complete len:123 (-),score=29.24 TRINITY_DN5664_c0_g1_i19:300-668(-)
MKQEKQSPNMIHLIFHVFCLVTTLSFLIAFMVITHRRKDKGCINEIDDFGPTLTYFHFPFLLFSILELAVVFGNFYGNIIGTICGWIQLLLCTCFVTLWIMAQVYLYQKNNDCKDSIFGGRD